MSTSCMNVPLEVHVLLCIYGGALPSKTNPFETEQISDPVFQCEGCIFVISVQ